jgi:hypothetical protein
MSQCLSFFTVLVIDGLRLSLHVFVFDWFCGSTIFAPLPAIFRCQGRRLRSRKGFPYHCSILLLTCAELRLSE